MDGPVGATDTSNGAWFMKHSMLECATVLGAITHEFLLVQEGGSNAWGKKVELDGLDRSPLFGLPAAPNAYWQRNSSRL
jgi:hypothetical protein